MIKYLLVVHLLLGEGEAMQYSKHFTDKKECEELRTHILHQLEITPHTGKYEVSECTPVSPTI